MNKTATAAESRYMGLVARLQCVICRRFDSTGLPTEVHHVAENSSRQNNWLVAPLCGNMIDGGHHRGAIGLHGPNGTKWFINFYKVPHSTEYGLLAWVNQDLQEMLGLKYPAMEPRRRTA